MKQRFFATVYAVVLLSLLATAFIPTASGQTTFGTITGTVTDPTGALIPSVPVTVTNDDTGVTRKASTGANGVYTIVDLQPGTYKLHAEAAGFVPVDRTGLALYANRVVNVDLQLSLGTSTTAVQMSGDAPVINTETA